MPAAAIDRDLRLDERRIRGASGRIVAAGHIDFDIAEAALREVRLQRGERAGAVMSGTSRRSSFATARCGRTVLPPGPGVAADQSFDVHRRPACQQFQRLQPIHIVDPVLHAHLLLGELLALALRRLANQRLLVGRERPHLVGEAVDRRVVPSGPPASPAPAPGATPGLSTRASLLECRSCFGPRPHVSPLETSSSSINALGAEVDGHGAVEYCMRQGMKTPAHLLSAASTSGRRTTCGKCGEPISSSPSATKTRFTGSFRPGAVDRMKGGQERGLRPLLVDRAAAHEHLAEPRLVHQRGLQWRRGPLGRIGLLHVVHEVDAERSRRARVQRREDAGLPVGGDLGDLRRNPASRSIRIIRSQPSFMPRFSAAIEGCRIHVLQAVHRLVMVLLDLGLNGFHVALGGVRAAVHGKRRGCCAKQKSASVKPAGTFERVHGCLIPSVDIIPLHMGNIAQPQPEPNPPEARPAETHATAWSLPHRLLFRFLFAYLVLYIAPTLVNSVPGISKLTGFYFRGWRAMVPWVAIHVFHLSGQPTTYFPTGSGDTTLQYIQNLLDLVFALPLRWSGLWPIAGERTTGSCTPGCASPFATPWPSPCSGMALRRSFRSSFDFPGLRS